MTPDERARLRELADQATPGEWVVYDVGSVAAELGRCTCNTHLGAHEPYCGIEGLITGLSVEDAEFIAAARTAIPALLDALDAAEAELAELKRPPERCPSCGFPKNVRPKRMIGRKIVTCNNDFHNDDMEARGE